MKIQLSSVPAAVEPLTADLAEETTEISESLEPEQEGGAGTASDHLLTSALTPAKAVQSANFKVVKMSNSAGETVEETIQKYVSNVSAQSGGQQIIILKYEPEAESSKVKQESTPTTRRELQQTENGLWMEVEVPIGAEINVNQDDQQTIIVEEMPMYFAEGSQVVEYHIASDEKEPAATTTTTTSAGGSHGKRTRTLVVDPSTVVTSKRQKKDPLLTNSSPYHKCSDCGEEFVAKYKLLAHRKIHDGKQPYSCSQCGEMFPVKNMLANHLMQHSGELTCSFCSRVLSTKRSLQRHIAQHTGDKEYKCTECEKDFFDRIQLVEHMRTHTGEKPFVCQVCQTAFARNSNLLAHMRIHRDEKPYHCEYCGREFRWRNNMVLHQKKHLEPTDSSGIDLDTYNEESNGTEASN